jgi:hypothetical protein
MGNTCATCKFWDQKDGDYYFGLGKCLACVEFWDATGWDNDGKRCLTDEFANCKAFTQDGSDYRAELLTKADFGCVSHEAKATQ